MTVHVRESWHLVTRAVPCAIIGEAHEVSMVLDVRLPDEKPADPVVADLKVVTGKCPGLGAHGMYIYTERLSAGLIGTLCPLTPLFSLSSTIMVEPIFVIAVRPLDLLEFKIGEISKAIAVW
jgi:hypothetical protein